jgi:hypothetical protein
MSSQVERVDERSMRCRIDDSNVTGNKLAIQIKNEFIFKTVIMQSIGLF